jgi:hypothetical protein
MHTKHFYWEPPCDNHDLVRPELLLSFIVVTGQVPGVIIHPDLSINSLGDWRERWEVPESRLWCEGSCFNAETTFNMHFKSEKATTEQIRFTSLTLFAGKNILFFDKNVGKYRFVVDNRYCIANEKTHDVLARLYKTYAI